MGMIANFCPVIFGMSSNDIGELEHAYVFPFIAGWRYCSSSHVFQPGVTHPYRYQAGFLTRLKSFFLCIISLSGYCYQNLEIGLIFISVKINVLWMYLDPQLHY